MAPYVSSVTKGLEHRFPVSLPALGAECLLKDGEDKGCAILFGYPRWSHPGDLVALILSGTGRGHRSLVLQHHGPSRGRPYLAERVYRGSRCDGLKSGKALQRKRWVGPDEECPVCITKRASLVPADAPQGVPTLAHFTVKG